MFGVNLNDVYWTKGEGLASQPAFVWTKEELMFCSKIPIDTLRSENIHKTHRTESA